MEGIFVGWFDLWFHVIFFLLEIKYVELLFFLYNLIRLIIRYLYFGIYFDLYLKIYLINYYINT